MICRWIQEVAARNRARRDIQSKLGRLGLWPPRKKKDDTPAPRRKHTLLEIEGLDDEAEILAVTGAREIRWSRDHWTDDIQIHLRMPQPERIVVVKIKVDELYAARDPRQMILSRIFEAVYKQ